MRCLLLPAVHGDSTRWQNTCIRCMQQVFEESIAHVINDVEVSETHVAHMIQMALQGWDARADIVV